MQGVSDSLENIYIFKKRPVNMPDILHSMNRCSLYLPLRLLTALELLEDGDVLLESHHLSVQGLVDLGLVLTKLGVEVLAVGGSRHSSREDGLDNEGVVGLEGVAVGFTEGVGQLGAAVVQVVAEGLGGEVKTSVAQDKLYISMCNSSGMYTTTQ